MQCTHSHAYICIYIYILCIYIAFKCSAHTHTHTYVYIYTYCVFISRLKAVHTYAYRAIADQTFAKKGELAQESYIYIYVPQERWLFSSTFLTLFTFIHIYLWYFCRFSRHRWTYCKNLRDKMSNIEVFMALWKSPKFDLGCLSSFFLLPFQFPQFLKSFWLS